LNDALAQLEDTARNLILAIDIIQRECRDFDASKGEQFVMQTIYKVPNQRNANYLVLRKFANHQKIKICRSYDVRTATFELPKCIVELRVKARRRFYKLAFAVPQIKYTKHVRDVSGALALR
jgi:hypothetical protein